VSVLSSERTLDLLTVLEFLARELLDQKDEQVPRVLLIGVEELVEANFFFVTEFLMD
jgi:hypothetical protein